MRVFAETSCFRGGSCRFTVPCLDPRKHGTRQRLSDRAKITWSILLGAMLSRLLCRVKLPSTPTAKACGFLQRHHAFAVGVAGSLFLGSIRESMAPDSALATAQK